MENKSFYEKSYYERNKEKVLKQKKDYYKKNKEKILQRYRDKREEKIEYQRQYKLKNAEVVKEKQRIYARNKRFHKKLQKIIEKINKMANLKKTNMTEYIATPDDLGDWMVELAKKHFTRVSDILEPCAGSNDLVRCIERGYPKKTIHKFDIEPQYADINRANFLKKGELDGLLEYKRNRLCIMNPPFTKTIKFINKAMEYCDYLVSLGSVNSIFNIDENAYEFLDIYIIKGQVYKDGTKVDTACYVLKRKPQVENEIKEE